MKNRFVTRSPLMIGMVSLFMATEAKDIPNKNDIYVGISLGKSFNKAKTNTRFDSDILDIHINRKFDVALDGFLYGFFAGVGTTVSKLYLGVEFSADLYSSEGRSLDVYTNGSNVNNNISIKKQNEFGFFGRVGYQYTNTLLIYLKGGVAIPNYQVRFSFDRPDSVSLVKRKSFTQFLGGFGAEWTIGKVANMEMRAGLECNIRLDKKFRVPMATNSFTSSGEFRMVNSDIKARLIFKF